MITIGSAQFDFRMESQPFAQALYGRWDDFCRLSFEKIVDDVLSRYDRPDTEIRLDSLTLDLGILSQEDFYEQFPRRLARQLAETFSTCLAEREAHAGRLEIVPVKKSRIDRFAFYMLHGYLSWEEERPEEGLAEWLNRLIDEAAEELLAFLHRHGSRQAVRARLVLQFADPQLDSLVALVVPSDSSFIRTFVRFLIESHKRMERPDVRAADYRQAVWGVVWAYLLSESKGYYSRKQFIGYTLRQLAARYNLTYLQLLDLLASGLHELTAVRVVIPELVRLLAEMRQEEWMRFTREKIQAEELSLRQLKELLSMPDSCRRMLRDQPEPVICGWVEKILPLESPFVIGYARALEEEKEKGLLEGKAGDDFRLIKWEFIFQLILGAMRDSFNRAAFVYGVLKQLAAHYNVAVGELLSYFYAGLVAGKVHADARLRELMIALFLEEADTWETFSVRRFPSPLAETLGNRYLCRRFLLPLAEEKIYKLVDRVIPSESSFIVHYARTLDKGKEENALAGKAGSEFRLLKWEFIFLLVLRAPLSYFSRKQFARSVLQQLAAHYNLGVAELIRFFYESLQASSTGIPREVGGILIRLFEDMEKESPELLLTVEARKEWKAACLKAFLAGCPLDGCGGRTPTERVEELEEFARETARREPDVLLEAAGSLRGASFRVLTGASFAGPACVRLVAFLLLFVIRRYGLSFPRQPLLAKMLEDAAAGHSLLGFTELHRLLYFCINGQAEDFQHVLDVCLNWRAQPGGGSAGSAGETAGAYGHPKGQEGQVGKEEEEQRRRESPEVSEVSEVSEGRRGAEKHARPEGKRQWPTGRPEGKEPLVAARKEAGKAVSDPEKERPLAAVDFSTGNEDKKTKHEAGSNEGSKSERNKKQGNKNEGSMNEGKRNEGTSNEGKSLEKKVSEKETREKEMQVKKTDRSRPPSGDTREKKTNLYVPAGAEDESTIPSASPDPFVSSGRAVSDFLPENSYRRLLDDASPACRVVAEEFLLLRNYVQGEINTSSWLSFLLSLTDKLYAYYSAEGLLKIAWEKLQRISSPEEMEKIGRAISACPRRWPGLAGVLFSSDPEKVPEGIGESTPRRVYVHNAGLVLLSPYLPRLFDKLHLLDASGRLSAPENQAKAIFAMQYLVTAEKEIPEYELFLNKLISGYPENESFSPFCEFEEGEKQILLSLLNAVKQNWDRMRNTSIEGFRNSFLLRDGELEEKEDRWLLTVDTRPYDLLLDTLPWSYSPVKFSWMNKPVYVRWR